MKCLNDNCNRMQAVVLEAHGLCMTCFCLAKQLILAGETSLDALKNKGKVDSVIDNPKPDESGNAARKRWLLE